MNRSSGQFGKQRYDHLNKSLRNCRQNSIRSLEPHPCANLIISFSGAISPALVHSAHLQQLQAHLIRSASTSPFLSPQNSLQATLLHSSAAAAAAVSAAAAFQTAPTTNPYFPFINPGCESKSSESALQGSCRGLDPVSAAAAASKQLETCSNVVSSTMEDEDSSSREGLTPLTTIKVRNLNKI